jgi:O-antigen ligase
VVAPRVRLPPPQVLVPLGAGLAALLLGVLAGVNPKLGIGAALGLTFVGVVVADLFVGFAVMVLFAYMETLSSLQGLSLAKIAGIVIAGSWLAVMTSGRSDIRNPFQDRPGLMYVLLLFVGWSAISITWSEDRGEATTSVTRYALNALLIPIAYTAVRHRGDVVKLFGVLLFGAGIAAISGIVDAPSASQYDVSRASGTAGDPNELAAALVIGFAVAAAFVVNRFVDVRVRISAGFVAVLCLAGIASTLSRGGLIGLAVAGVVAIVVGGRWRGRVTAAAVGVALAGLAYFLVFASSGARDRVLMSNGGSGRIDLWTIGLRMVDAHPIRGIGTGQYIVSSVHYLLRPGVFERGDLILTAPKIAHNTYLGTLAELGAVGLALFLGVVIICGHSMWLALKSFEEQGDEKLEILVRGLFIGCCGYAASLFFISENYKKAMWLMLALGPVLLAVARSAADQTAERRRVVAAQLARDDEAADVGDRRQDGAEQDPPQRQLARPDQQQHA